MSDKPLFQDADEQERTLAPQQVPSERRRVVADEGADVVGDDAEIPSAAPVASVGTTQVVGAAPPNLGNTASGGAPGDPETRARNPMGDSDRNTNPKR
jgi:hypothetical protein